MKEKYKFYVAGAILVLLILGWYFFRPKKSSAAVEQERKDGRDMADHGQTGTTPTVLPGYFPPPRTNQDPSGGDILINNCRASTGVDCSVRTL